jgi:ferredoxin
MPEYKGCKQPVRANEKELRAIHVVPVPDDKKVEVALQHLDEMRKKFRSFVLAMESCVKCGACAENCHTYLGTRDPQQHSRQPGGTDPQDLPPLLYRRGPLVRQAVRRRGPDPGYP